jgi:hypothetical protein
MGCGGRRLLGLRLGCGGVVLGGGCCRGIGVRLGERFLESAGDRGLHCRRRRFDEFAHVLELFKDGLAVYAKFLGEFIYACFRHSISPISQPRIHTSAAAYLFTASMLYLIV